MCTCGGVDFYSHRYLVQQRKTILVAKNIGKNLLFFDRATGPLNRRSLIVNRKNQPCDRKNREKKKEKVVHFKQLRHTHAITF
jgi:hypothetical protein